MRGRIPQSVEASANEVIDGGLVALGRRHMEWFSRRTSIGGVQVSNWMIVLGAIIVVLLIYSSMH
jgi:hypothetical protein